MTRSKPPSLPPKEDAPEALAESVDLARTRTRKRRHGPPIEFQRDSDGKLVRDDRGDPVWDWPFSDGPDGKPWFWLVLDAFGTRNPTVATVFINYLLKLVGSEWDEDGAQWLPDDGELQAILHIVSAHKPKNELQAGMAAERAATMLLTMKLAERVARYPHDHRTVASYARLAAVGTAQSQAILDVQGKRKASTQKITVRRENHVHYHDHRPAGGSGESDDQPHAQGPCSPALPRADSGGEVVLLTGCTGPEGLPDARGRRWRAEG